MTEPLSNDNHLARGDAAGGSPDAHGQAAMLLVESLIHGLIARSLLTVADAVEIVATAAEVKLEVAAEAGDTPSALHRSLALLEAIGGSLGNDLPGGGAGSSRA